MVKKIGFVFSIFVLVGMATFVTVTIIKESKAGKPISEIHGTLSAEPIVEPVEEPFEDYGNTAGEVGEEIYRLFQFDESGLELDECFGSYADNILFLEYSRMCLEEYLAHWLNNDVITVTDQTSRLFGTYVAGSYKEDDNFPSWDVIIYLNGEKHKIRCIYNVSKEAFTYKSDLEG